jgi:hypothetical protein
MTEMPKSDKNNRGSMSLHRSFRPNCTRVQERRLPIEPNHFFPLVPFAFSTNRSRGRANQAEKGYPATMRHPFLRALLPALLVVVAGRELQQVEITAAPTVYRTLILLFVGSVASRQRRL